ncbi:MAG TPA: metallophosphoesterase, partial [Longimicrobiales bacterium]|nr:metallophosphoesterase [Longimicrobiales bacterium]
RLGVIGDVHGNAARLAPVLDAVAARGDVRGKLVTGDLGGGSLGRGGRLWAPGEILAILRGTALPFVFVPGNHDAPRMDEPENVDGRIADFLGFRVLGIGGSPRAFGLPYEWEDGSARIAEGACDLILSHAPPAGTRLGITSKGADAGSRQVRGLLGRRPHALVCGHIHEAVGIETVDGVPCYNAGAIGGMFAGSCYGVLTLGGAAAFEHVQVPEGATR